MGPYREEAVGLVGRLRAVWPDGDIVDLTKGRRYEVDRIISELYGFIIRMGHPERTISKLTKTPFRRSRSIEDISRKDMESFDLAQEFWVGVTNGLSSVKPRISPNGEIDVNDPLEFLIHKGAWRVMDVRRAYSTKKIMQRCHICGSKHRLYRPNLSHMAFDPRKCVDIRGDRGEDLDCIAEYRKLLLKEKLKRSLVKNPCKVCFEEGLAEWYPIFDPSEPGDKDFELDIDQIDFMVFSIDLDVMEVYCSGSSTADDEGINFLENVSDEEFEIEDEHNVFGKIDAKLDLKKIKKYIFIDDRGQYELHRMIFDTMFGADDEICSICPRRYRSYVQNGLMDYTEAVCLVNSNLYDVETPTEVSMCGWESEYKKVDACSGIPNIDCDNIEQRMANYFGLYIPQVRAIKKFIENRYGAYRTVDGIIGEVVANDSIR